MGVIEKLIMKDLHYFLRTSRTYRIIKHNIKLYKHEIVNKRSYAISMHMEEELLQEVNTIKHLDLNELSTREFGQKKHYLLYRIWIRNTIFYRTWIRSITYRFRCVINIMIKELSPLHHHHGQIIGASLSPSLSN